MLYILYHAVTARNSIWVSLNASLVHSKKNRCQKAVSTLDKGESALAEHVCYTKYEIAWENSKVITTNNCYGQRRKNPEKDEEPGKNEIKRLMLQLILAENL
jgi:hypothetical protein